MRIKMMRLMANDENKEDYEDNEHDAKVEEDTDNEVHEAEEGNNMNEEVDDQYVKVKDD